MSSRSTGTDPAADTAASTRAHVRGFLEITRPGNAIAAGVLTLTGAFVAGGTFAEARPVAAAVLATAFAVGAGNTVNDYFDREIDAINRPDRPIPRGDVSPRGALAFAGLLFALAVVLALTLPRAAIFIAVFNLLLLVAYTKLFKGLPGVGNLVVGFLTGSTFLFGGAAVGEPFGAVVLFALAAIATLTREIVKDVEDIEGDREEGLNTLPIAIGVSRSLWLGLAAIVVAVVASVIPYLYGPFGIPYLVVVVPADIVMLAATRRAFSDPSIAQRRLKGGMLVAVFAFIVGQIGVVV